MNIEEESLKKLEKSLQVAERKIQERIDKKDYEGAITASRTFLEGVFHNIYFILLGNPISPKYNDLRDKWNLIKKLLSLDPEKKSDQELKSLCYSISSMISQIENITNLSGDKHFTLLVPKEYLANFMAEISKSFSEFLYHRLKFLYNQYPQEKVDLIYNSLIKILDSHKRGWERDELLKDEEINNLFLAFEKDSFVIRKLIDKFIGEYEISQYRENDIFFAAVRIFFDFLSKEYVNLIWKKCKDNNQTCPPYGGLLSFMHDIQKLKPELLSQDMRKWINKLKKQKT